MSYYDDELQLILNTNHSFKFKITGNNNDTKFMNINLDSIESLQAFLVIVKEDLERSGY